MKTQKDSNKHIFLTRKLDFAFATLTVLSLYSLGNFGFFNIFNIKYEVYYTTIILITAISLIKIKHNIKKAISDPIFIVYLYLLSCSLLSDISISFAFKMAFLVLTFSYLLNLRVEYIDFILKSSITITFIFSAIGCALFLYYQFNPELLVNVERVFRSYDTFKDLSYIPLHQKFGFVIDAPEKNLFNIEYIRSRSFCSEPSATIPLFFTIGILSFLYEKKFKILGCVILFFSIVLVYSGSVILSLLASLLFIILLFLFKPNEKLGSYIILTSIILTISFISIVDISIFTHITPEAKVTSAPSRLIPIANEVRNIISNPTYNNTYQTNSFIGLGLLYLGTFPFIGILISILFFHATFKNLIIISNKYFLFSSLMTGLIIQITLFSSNGWLTPTGSIILCLSWIKIKSLVEQNKFKKQTS